MSKHIVRVKEWAAGDWYEVYVDGEQFDLCSGHGIGAHDLKGILRKLGVEVAEEIVEDEEDEDE